MTLEKQLKHYVTHLFSLPKNEEWECEAIDEVSDNILPDQYVRLGPLTNKILHTCIYYSDTFMKNIYTPLSSTIRINSLRLVILMKRMIWTSYTFITQLCHY